MRVLHAYFIILYARIICNSRHSIKIVTSIKCRPISAATGREMGAVAPTFSRLDHEISANSMRKLGQLGRQLAVSNYSWLLIAHLYYTT